MREVETEEELLRELAGDGLAGRVVQGLDLAPHAARLHGAAVSGTVFLGCRTPGTLAARLIERGALLFPRLDDLPFDPYRRTLYTPDELYEGFDPGRPESYATTRDALIYAWWRQTGGGEPEDLRVTLARRLHDLSIHDGIQDLLGEHRPGSAEPTAAAEGVETAAAVAASRWPRRIAIMGGHSLRRDDPLFREVTALSTRIALRGWLVISGGGPGAMEAAHLGCWLHGASKAEREHVFETLAAAPEYHDVEWLSRAFTVRRRLAAVREPRDALVLPTCHYGHEPPNPFATRIAKKFNNSLREEGLVTLATGGIVFTPGSAGTVQEIFQDAAQNHYRVGGLVCPMVFLGREHWSRRLPVWPLIEALSEGRLWGRRVALVETVDEAVEALDRLTTVEF